MIFNFEVLNNGPTQNSKKRRGRSERRSPNIRVNIQNHVLIERMVILRKPSGLLVVHLFHDRQKTSLRKYFQFQGKDR